MIAIVPVESLVFHAFGIAKVGTRETNTLWVVFVYFAIIFAIASTSMQSLGMAQKRTDGPTT